MKEGSVVMKDIRKANIFVAFVSLKCLYLILDVLKATTFTAMKRMKKYTSNIRTKQDKSMIAQTPFIITLFMR